MRLLIFNHIQNARDSLRSNKGRSFLTMVGITIGVASITTILALSGGASQIVRTQIDELGGNVAVVRPGQVELAGLDQLAQLPSQQFATSSLIDSDIQSIKRIDGVQVVAPLMIITGAVKGEDDAPKNTPIIATTPELEQANQLELRDGQFLDPELKITTAVIGPQLAVNVFGTEAAIGKTITLRGEAHTIIGVLERTNTPINYNGVDFDNAVIVSRDSGRIMNQGVSQIQQINVRTESVAVLDEVITDINQALLRNHYGEPDFSVLSGADIAQPTSELFAAIAGVTAAIAAISLIVGGIGVMNIMLVSVAERTREIGIRKAVGASNSDIVSQFLIESLFLSVGGGVAGYIIGYLLAFGISTFLTFEPIFSWEIAAVAIVVSLVVGVLFGLYPAVRAARKDPISALRQYD
ncbi:MAG TPA: ABC transporter permease [Candidatus Saccharimonadaceae bacterium]|nr:ABC transporter permease [Candidatus Saccharimonadaceae bacterium]